MGMESSGCHGFQSWGSEDPGCLHLLSFESAV